MVTSSIANFLNGSDPFICFVKDGTALRIERHDEIFMGVKATQGKTDMDVIDKDSLVAFVMVL